MPTNSVYFTQEFWIAALERAIKTTAQVVAGSGLIAVVPGLPFDWRAVLALGIVTFFLSIFTSIGSATVGDKGSPSLGGEVLKQ